MSLFLFFSCKTQKNNGEKKSLDSCLTAGNKINDVVVEGNIIVSAEPKIIVNTPKTESIITDKKQNIKPKLNNNTSNINDNDKKIIHLKPKQRETDGTIFYNIPDTMKVRKTEIIKVRITKAKVIDNLIDDMSDNNVIKAMFIKTTSDMSVKIVDPTNSFEIGSVNSNTQTVETDSTTYTEWVFSVTPIKSGNNTIRIVITTTDGNSIKEKIQETKVFIKPNILYLFNDFVKINWQWIIGFLTPIISAFFVWFKKRKKKDS
jgi:hypothetical protein